MSARRERPARDAARRLTDGVSQSRRDLARHVDRIAKIQMHLDETLARLDEISRELRRLREESADLRKTSTRVRTAARTRGARVSRTRR